VSVASFHTNGIAHAFRRNSTIRSALASSVTLYGAGCHVLSIFSRFTIKITSTIHHPMVEPRRTYSELF